MAPDIPEDRRRRVRPTQRRCSTQRGRPSAAPGSSAQDGQTATLSSLPNQSPPRHLTAEHVGTDGSIGRCGRQDSAEPPSWGGMLNSRSGSSKREAARLSGEPPGKCLFGRGSTKQALLPHDELWQRSPYACSAYAYSLLSTHGDALDGSRNTVLPVSGGKDFLCQRAGGDRDHVGV